MEVAIELIKPSPYQPRLFFDTDDLKEEIQRDGLLSALVVRKKDEYYELLDGERRLRTLKELGWKTVPVDVRDVDDTTARRSVFKLNKIRESYNTEEEARYYKKLESEGMSPWEISQELGVSFSWVLANLNVFLFPQDIQDEILTPRGELSMSHIKLLEKDIARNIDEATEYLRGLLKGPRVSSRDLEKAISERETRVEARRLEAAKKGLPEEAVKLETPEDYEKAAQALKEEAKRRAEEAMTPEEKAALEAETKARAEAQAAAKAEREEKKRQQKAEEEGRRQERAEARARAELKGDKGFVKEALRAMPQEERLEILDLAPTGEKVKQPKSLSELFQEVTKEASQLLTKLEKLQADPGFQELDLEPLALDLSMLADGFRELSEQVGERLGKK